MARRYSVQVRPLPRNNDFEDRIGASSGTSGIRNCLDVSNLDRPPVNPGPVQFSGPLSQRLCLLLEDSSFQVRSERIKEIEGLCKKLKLLASDICFLTLTQLILLIAFLLRDSFHQHVGIERLLKMEIQKSEIDAG